MCWGGRWFAAVIQATEVCGWCSSAVRLQVKGEGAGCVWFDFKNLVPVSGVSGLVTSVAAHPAQ